MSIVSNAKEVADLVKKLGDIELYRKIVALEEEILDLTREKRELESSVEELNESLRLKAVLTYKKPFYYQENEVEPYCPNCWENDGKAIHLFDVAYSSTFQNHHFACPTCKRDYKYQGQHA